ncbi:hypothetical protein Gotri_024403 [Gossypium trilobum]|uniref:Glycosyltransferase subfamily 4-like N-terminal domain-containing protein n=2 Tax=Gossypium trilobum TaxID=34281 RepID=A0A7J9DM31_9ROSI|nr:hypothetical protein [Gossypium trilobum]
MLKFHNFCFIIAILAAFSFIPILYKCQLSSNCYSFQKPVIDLLTFPSSWNLLYFPSDHPPQTLKIALFVKKWPQSSHAGGLERHALTLHLALAKRGHQVHIFTTFSPNTSIPNLVFHLSEPTVGGYLNQTVVWSQFRTQNSTATPFDIVHTESVGLMHAQAKDVTNLAVTWHGIAYESIHSDIIQELLRAPEEQQAAMVTKKDLHDPRRTSAILNGVDEAIFRTELSLGNELKHELGIPQNGSLILGMSGRLVKDKGHPLIFQALKEIFMENNRFQQSVVLVIAGDGPWGARYKDRGANILVLGPLGRADLAKFYNAIDIFVHPTLRGQGLDQTPLEAILSGKPVMTTRVASLTGSVIVGPELGYTFSPTVESLKKTLYRVWKDGKVVLEKKGKAARQRGLKLFTATKMTAAYERLFLCMPKEAYCKYPNPFY